MKHYTAFKKELLRKGSVRNAYDELGPEFGIIALLVRKRLEKKITQRELAERIGTKQSAIARLESGTYNPSIAFLYKIANALDAKLRISVSAK